MLKFIQARYPDLFSARVISYSIMTGYGIRHFIVFETDKKTYKVWIYEDPIDKGLDLSNYEETKKNWVFPDRPSNLRSAC